MTDANAATVDAATIRYRVWRDRASAAIAGRLPDDWSDQRGKTGEHWRERGMQAAISAERRRACGCAREQHRDTGEEQRNLPHQPQAGIDAAERNLDSPSKIAQEKWTQAGDDGHTERRPEPRGGATPRSHDRNDTEQHERTRNEQRSGIRRQLPSYGREVHRRTQQRQRKHAEPRPDRARLSPRGDDERKNGNRENGADTDSRAFATRERNFTLAGQLVGDVQQRLAVHGIASRVRRSRAPDRLDLHPRDPISLGDQTSKWTGDAVPRR